jgi:isopenicillin-N N-acyltransferase like protein
MTRGKRIATIVLAVLLAPFAAHVVVGWATHVEAPPIAAPDEPVTTEGDVRRAPHGWAANRGVHLVYLRGTPEAIGRAHAALLYDGMVATERVVWNGFRTLVPSAPLRTLLFDIGRVRHYGVDRHFPEARRREVAAEALGFRPDPFDRDLATYERLAMLYTLYDIALGFEHSPLLGCTAFGLGPDRTSDGHALFARAFDFEAAEVFDREKVVFIVHEDGAIPFASVAWPGFLGVVTGMNAEGVAVAVHGARAREPSSSGMPVAFSLRETLAGARNTNEAVAILSRQDVMVSHLVFVGDAAGHYAVVERAPGIAATVRASAAVTNHFEGPLAGDPRDTRVRNETTTLARRSRIDALLAGVAPHSASIETALALLRDHACEGTACKIGDRRAIDAFIATHGVVADLTTKTLWISAGPRLSGRFVKLDPSVLVRQGDEPIPVPGTDVASLPEDPALHDGRYMEGRARAGGPLFSE